MVAALALLAGVAAQPAATATPTAEAILDRSRLTLVRTSSLQARIVERVDFGGRRYEAAGDYVAGAYPQLRLRLEIPAGDLRARLLEICDGEVLWTIREIAATQPAENEEPSPERIVLRRDVDRIQSALRDPVTAEQIMIAELGLGGLPALLSGLQSNFDCTLTGVTPASYEIEGSWKQDRLAAIGIDPERVPDTLPDLAMISIERKTLIPKRIAYLKRSGQDDTESTRPMLMVELREVRIGDALAHDVFSYKPPQGANVEDVTKQTLDRLDATRAASAPVLRSEPR